MNKKKATVMTEGNIWKQLVLFALPLMAGNLFQMLYNTVDSVVVGNFVGKEALAAVGSTAAIINMLVGFFMGLSTGAGVIVSQYYGAKNDKKLSEAVHTAMMMTFVLGIILSILGVVLTPFLLKLMATPDDVLPNSTLYLRIYFSGLMGLMIYNMGSGILRAVGDSKRPLYFLMISSVINIIGDLLLVVVFKMGIAGVAIATIIAQAASALVVFGVLMKSKEAFGIRFNRLKIVWPEMRRIFIIGLPAGIQQSITAFSNIFVQSYINKFGSACMAGWSSYSKIDQFVLLPVMSLSLASTTFVGQNIGAKKLDRVREGIRKALILSVSVNIILTICLNLAAKPLLSMFNHEPEVLKFGLVFVRYMSPFYFTICFNQIFAGALRGAGDSTAPTIIMLASFVAFRQVSLFVGTRIWPNVEFVALAYPIGWILCSTLLILYYRSNRWMRKLEL